MAKKANYQDSMERLEEILENIDSSEVNVDELAEQVSEAATLLKTCKQILTKTEKDVNAALETLDEEFDESE
jgi:exodeoxyribonuclease VII small subunit